jgi:hypothetical protein
MQAVPFKDMDISSRNEPRMPRPFVVLRAGSRALCEGGIDAAVGKEEIRCNWTRQWKELDPHVEPTGRDQP